jgi:hypothetical protein
MRELRSSGQTKVQRTLNRSEAEFDEVNVPERSSIKAVADFKAIICPPPPKFIKCADLDFTTSPAIAFIQCCSQFFSVFRH